jgi:hypothetical protein
VSLEGLRYLDDRCRTRADGYAFGCAATIFGKRLLKLALMIIRIARFVDVNIGMTPRNVRSEGVNPCKCA